MSVERPPVPGWYPDPAKSGTRYWDGHYWVASRPERQPYAARAHHRGWGLTLLIFGVFSVLTSPTHPFNPESGETFVERLGIAFLSLVLGLVSAAAGLYLLRGRGPTEKAVQELSAQAAYRRAVAAPRQDANPAAPPTPVEPVRPPMSDAARVAQINALANPDTAQALQNLNHLRYTRVITEDEFRAAKARLLGD
ncbi:DUF2510 domain-containing protein [Nocardioides caeni]|uniref:DUF2510 domain-containing protein n=1 Tax=Nocardioides caeni TaxID=574700 RepID=UPI0013052813|nr:DUF2510 domain-containing protein [Nocardioides caeni]